VAAVQSLPDTNRLAELPAAEVAARLYEAYNKRILRYCVACLRSREEAEDAAQSTFLYAFRALERGIRPDAEVPWLLAIARNVCMARHRTSGRRRERETLHDPVVLQDVSAAPERTEGLVGLEDALARLPETQRRAILLREWRGFSYREIADELGLSGAAVETLIFRARRSLAEQLDGERAQGRRRALRSLDVGSAAAALKSLLGVGTAAKLIVGAATVTTVVAVAGGTVLRDRTPVAVPHPPPVSTTVLRTDVREHTTLGARSATPAPGRDAKARSPKPERKPQPPAASGDPSSSEPVGVVEEAVSPVADEVAELVLELPEPSLPALPDLPVELPAAPELAPPDLPLP
jgi:RNA polymerase sigma factor (sigma-70 family)